MNSKKYFVLEELLELSQKADEIIENTFSDSCFNDQFFEDAKNKIIQIVNGSFKAVSNYSENRVNRQLKFTQTDYSNDPFMKIRSHIRPKRHSTEIRKETSTSTNLSSIGDKEHRNSGVVFISSSENEENTSELEQHINEENLTIKISDSHDTSSIPSEQDVATNQDYISPSVEDNFKISSPEELSSETNECIDVTPNARIPVNVTVKTYVCKKNNLIKFSQKSDKNDVNFEDVLLDRRVTRSSKSALGIFLDESFDISEKTSCKTDDILNRTYLIDSKSSKETVKGSDTLVSRNTVENEKNTHINIMSLQSGKSKDSSIRNYLGSSSTSSFSEENELIPKLKRSYNLKPLTDNAYKIKTVQNNMNCVTQKNFGIRRIVKNKTPYFENGENSNSDFSEIKCLSNILSGKYVSYPEKDKRERSKSVHSGKEPPSKTYKMQDKIRQKDIAFKEHIRAKSGPAIMRELRNRPNKLKMTVEDRLNNNRKFSKDTANEKAKQREIRIRKARERRELLEKERKERIQMKEQKLKCKLQKHEIIFKQQRKKIRKRIRPYKEKSEQSLPSTSSSDSKDRSKDNDNFYRNSAQHISQESSEENNFYHEESLEKVSTASLEGNVGLNPKISTEHNSILKDNRKTPVEPSVSSDVIHTQIKNIPANQDRINKKDLHKIELHKIQKKKIEGTEQQGALLQLMPSNRCLKKSSSEANCLSLLTKEHKFNKLGKKCQKHDKTEDYSEKITQSKVINDMKSVSNEIFFEHTPKTQEYSYFLRSTKKMYPNKMSNTPHEKINHSNNLIHKNSHEIVPSSSEDVERKFFHSCFSSCKKNKSKKFWKCPSSCKIIRKRKSVDHTNKVPSATYFTKSTKKNCKKKIIKKTSTSNKQDLMSYKISDMTENSFDESEVDLNKIPQWATGVYLKQALIQQYYACLNPKEIFGPVLTDPVNLAAIFQIDKPVYRLRTSSEKWNKNDSPF